MERINNKERSTESTKTEKRSNKKHKNQMIQMVWHIKRHSTVMKTLLKGKMEGKREMGQQ